jgi:hypothetical protein
MSGKSSKQVKYSDIGANGRSVWIPVLLSLCCASVVFAGPPFVTDDPEPVELHHWEFYAATEIAHDHLGSSGTLPHFEVNYGAVPNLQIHAIFPVAFSRPNGGENVSGLGDIEIGLKYRFVQEGAGRPMIGLFPLFELPTGDSNRGLGSGQTQMFLPLWLEKSWGPWTSYGGGGYFVNPGSGNKDYWLAGWEIQRDLGETLTLGGELYGTTPQADGSSGTISFNLGGQVNLGEKHHLLFSIGRSLNQTPDLTAYLAYQLTVGPPAGK